MTTLEQKFSTLATEHAPGQAIRQNTLDIDSITHGQNLKGIPVDFSHGDIDAFPPSPTAFEAWRTAYKLGGQQAYTEYRGAADIRLSLATRLEAFTCRAINADREFIITPGTQGALFLARGVSATSGTTVAIVEPDYFANRKLVRFFGGEIVPIPLHYRNPKENHGPDLDRLESVFKDRTKVFVLLGADQLSSWIRNWPT